MEAEAPHSGTMMYALTPDFEEFWDKTAATVRNATVAQILFGWKDLEPQPPAGRFKGNTPTGLWEDVPAYTDWQGMRLVYDECVRRGWSIELGQKVNLLGSSEKTCLLIDRESLHGHRIWGNDNVSLPYLLAQSAVFLAMRLKAWKEKLANDSTG